MDVCLTFQLSPMCWTRDDVVLSVVFKPEYASGHESWAKLMPVILILGKWEDEDDISMASSFLSIATNNTSPCAAGANMGSLSESRPACCVLLQSCAAFPNGKPLYLLQLREVADTPTLLLSHFQHSALPGVRSVAVVDFAQNRDALPKMRTNENTMCLSLMSITSRT